MNSGKRNTSRSDKNLQPLQKRCRVCQAESYRRAEGYVPADAMEVTLYADRQQKPRYVEECEKLRNEVAKYKAEYEESQSLVGRWADYAEQVEGKMADLQGRITTAEQEAKYSKQMLDMEKSRRERAEKKEDNLQAENARLREELRQARRRDFQTNRMAVEEEDFEEEEDLLYEDPMVVIDQKLAAGKAGMMAQINTARMDLGFDQHTKPTQ